MNHVPQIAFDAATTGSDALGDLPEWDLTDLYPAPNSPELKRDMDWLEQACSDFAADYEGKLANLDAKGLLDAVLRYERIDVVAGRIMSYAGLRYYQITTDAERAKFVRLWVSSLVSPTAMWRATFGWAGGFEEGRVVGRRIGWATGF